MSDIPSGLYKCRFPPIIYFIKYLDNDSEFFDNLNLTRVTLCCPWVVS
ncbi:hypothetical protein TRIP_C21617 [Candidatus Zixiibacteriota bacterium]|nr:hypothetical protein TRIP_C21617 [candidate division Zixibacteria bacterium]